MSRPILRFAATHSGTLVARSIEWLASTWDLSVSGEEHVESVRETGAGIVFCFWHGRMLELVCLHARTGVGVLVSGHADGVMAARIIEPLGYVPIQGSRRYAPVAGFRAMLRHAEAGGDLALTPDAHSDAHRVLPGAIALARLTGNPLVAVAAGSDRCRRIESWDRFEVPWPGSKVLVRYAEPVWLPEAAGETAIERATSTLEERLRTMHADLERELTGGRPRETVPRPQPTLRG